MDALRDVQSNMLKITRTFNNSSYDYPVQVQQSLINLSTTVTREIQQLALTSAADRAAAVQTPTTVEEPKTLMHGLARVAA